MRILKENPDLSQCELSERLDMNLGWLNYSLNAWIDKGFMKMGNFYKRKQKFMDVYLFTPQGIAEKVALTRRFLKRKMEEYDTPKVEIAALQSDIHKSGEQGNQKA